MAVTKIHDAEFTEQGSDPTTPTASTRRIYPKADGWYDIDDAGTVTKISGAATTALDNLASTQVNTDIIPDTDDTHGLGSSSAVWADGWFNNLVGDLEIQVYNDTGVDIAIEQVVFVSGFDVGSDLPEVSLADSDAGSNADRAIGITKTAITNGSTGRIVINGRATYPTSGMSVGDELYLSTTAGSLTNTRPTSGRITDFGTVLKVGGSGTGIVFVNPQGVEDLNATETLTNKTLDGDDNTIRLKTSSANVSNPPTDAELDSAFGTPATVGNGFSALLDDAGGDANVYAVYSNGTSWFYTTLTKAV